MFPLLLQLFLLTTASTSEAQRPSTSFEKEWSFKEGTLFSYDRSLAKLPDTFVYAYCNTSDFQQKNDCTFVRYDLESTHSKSCHTKLYGSQEKNFNFVFERFKSNELLIVRLEVDDHEVQSKYSLLNISTCNVLDSQDKFVDWMQTVTYQDSFDVIYSSESCGTSRVCRVTRNSKNEVVNTAPFPDNLNIELVVPVSPDGPAEGFFVVGHRFGSYVVAHVTESGETTFLLTHPLDYVNKCQYTPRSNGQFGVCCDVSSNEMRCNQLWKDDDTWRSSSIDLKKQRILAMHNAENGGGLIILVSECVEALDLSFCGNTSAIRFNKDGTKEALFDIVEPVFTCSTYKDLTSVEMHEGRDGLCVDFAYTCFVQTREGYRSVLKLNRKCHVA